MKNKLFCISYLMGLLLLSKTSFEVNAQKLPNKQQASIWAPANIKIDGNANEWDNKFQAYNHATDIYYTISNDKENLYLTVMVDRGLITDKILREGLSFSINGTEVRKDASKITITYPVLQGADRNAVTGLFFVKMKKESDAKNADYSLESLNKLFESKANSISVKGINSIGNEDISVYNEQGIKAVARFQKPSNYVYELAVPLKYLKLTDGAEKTLNYLIKLNVTQGPTPVATIRYPDLLPPPPPARASVATTDFSGEYILAKAP